MECVTSRKPETWQALCAVTRGCWACCQADDQQTALVPSKVVNPVVPPRIEDGHFFSGQRVSDFQSVGPQLVASMATQPQVLAIVRSAQRGRQQVLDFQAIGEYLLGASAVSALELRVSGNELIEAIGYPLSCQCRGLPADKLGWWRNGIQLGEDAHGTPLS